MAWNPARYMAFGQARLRPALDLLAQAVATAGDGSAVTSVLDLGCGPGNLTGFLRDAFPKARVTGMDTSEAMLEAARAKAAEEGWSNVSFVKASIEEFESKEGFDVIYTNAALHWVPDHRKLLPRVFQQLKPGGVFAMQIPDTRAQASHLLMETAAENLGLDISTARIPRCEEDPAFYVDVLGELCEGGAMGVNAWATEYAQMLQGDNPVAAYTRSTGLQAVLKVLGGEGAPEADKLHEEYKRLIADAYPALASGVTVFPFKRFFVVAQKRVEA